VQCPTKQVLLLTVFTLSAVSCARRIPPSVGEEEYDVYSTWVATHVAGTNSPPDVFIERTTSPAKDFIPDSVVAACRKGERLVDPLLALGDAEYTLDRKPTFKLPFEYQFVDGRPTGATNPYRIFNFSRIAFNRSGSEGVFAVFSSGCSVEETDLKHRLVCGGGRGGIVHADRTEQSAEWRFVSGKNCPVTIE
jgi:hypothetical protein